jgi:phosphatidylserine/phosphatidylglycerophosphate/cardiolipin synthase-like enzyme
VGELYKQIKEDPERYPRGLTVRILLGNYPEISDLQWGTQIIDALNEIRAAGVEKMIDPEIGWRLEVANYAGTYPHSHTKFLVVDGLSATAAGFNYGYLHFPVDHPSGKGYDLLDLALQVNGPVAQESISVYDDMWEGANQVHCDDFFPPEGQDWQDTCQEIKASSEHLPEVLRTNLPPEGDSNSFSLYRNSINQEADNVIANSLAAAEDTVKIMQANFSLEMICMINIVFPDVCTFENALPFMESIVEAVERDHVHVRVIMENTNSNGLENRVGGSVLMEELESRGLEEFVELRFNKDKIHSKAILIDDELLFIGSQNLHYSAWGSGSGLNEYSITTNDTEAIAEFNAFFESKWEEAIPFEESEFSSSP